MQVSDQMIDHLSKLSRLDFTGEDREAMKADLENMIAFADKLNELDTTNIAPLTHLSAAINITRDDIVKPELTQEAALRNVPLHNHTFVKLPKAIHKPE